MKPQPEKKALMHLDKVESFSQRLKDHLEKVREILGNMGSKKSDTSKVKVKKKRRI